MSTLQNDYLNTKKLNANNAWIIGNYKQNPQTIDALTTLVKNTTILCQNAHSNIALAPSFVHLPQAHELLQHSRIQLGAQNVAHTNDSTGAFTGDVSAAMLADIGASFVIIGHSEQRQHYNESADVLSQKIDHSTKHNLFVVFCVGESKMDYDAKNTLDVLTKQLSVLNNKQGDIIIAYEPIWAIGTGLTPTIDEIRRVHQHIKAFCQMQLNRQVQVLYGGSVNEKNATMLAQCDLVDGVLVGGASLVADKFAAIVDAFEAKNAY